MADTGGTPGLPGGENIPRLPGSGGGGKNPLEKKELDILDPEAKPEEQGKKGLGDIAKGIKKTADKVKKIINFLKNIPPQVLLIIAIVVIIIFVIVGVIGFILFIPGLAINALKQFAQGAIDAVQSWFTTEADAYINPQDVVDLANYLEELEYDLVGYGFITPNPNYATMEGYLTTSELAEQGYIYFERRGDDENARYYSQSAEEDPDGNSAYDGYYYNSLGILMDNSTGQMVDDENYIDQYGLLRSTEEISNSGAGKILSFGDNWLLNAVDLNVDTTLLRTYLLSDYRIYSIRNNDKGLLTNIYTTIKQTFGGYDSAWSKGLVKFYYSENGQATGEWSSGLGHWIVYGDDIKITRTSTGAKMSVKNGHFNNPTVFTIDGWADRYGMSLEFLLSLHIATMQPDLVYAMLQSFDTEVQVYLEDSGDATVDAAYVDMLDESRSISNDEDRIMIDKVEQTLSDTGHDFAAWGVNDMAALEWVNGLVITKSAAQDLLVNLPLKSPPNCTGQAQDQVVVLATDDTVFGWRWASTNSLNTYGLTEDSENRPSVYDIFDDYEEYYYYDSDGNHYIMSVDNCDASLGTGNEAYLNDNYSYFADSASGVNLSDYGYVASEAAESEPETRDIETSVRTVTGGANVFYTHYRTKEVRTTRTYFADVDGEDVGYEWITVKYLVYNTGVTYGDGDNATENEYEEPVWIDTIIFEFIIRDKTTQELVDAGLLTYDEETGEYIPVDPTTTRCSDDPGLEKCCANCKRYVKDVIQGLAAISDQDYASYTPYISRVLGSWFRDTYFVVPSYADTAIQDYTNEAQRSQAELDMINNSWGENATFVEVDEEYLADTGEYWTAYDMKEDESGNPTEEYQLYYLYPNGITSEIKMEDFLEDPYTVLEGYQQGYAARYNVTSGTRYDSEEEAEEAGHAFVKKAKVKTLDDLSDSSIENVLWSAYEFNSDGAATGWIRVEYDDDNDEVNDVYDTIGEDYPNQEGGFYYNITSTNEVTQVEDAQRSQTNPTVKWLFKYRKYYTYDGSEETAMRIAKDKEAVLNWAQGYLMSNYGSAKNVANNLLGKYGRSALRQTYGETFLSYATAFSLASELSFDWEDVTEQWLDWQLDMYYSGIITCPENDYKLGGLAFIATLDENGDTISIRETYDFNYTPQDGEELRIGDPRNPDLIRTTNITKTSLEAFTILENTKTLASEYAYRDFKELIVELDYFDKEDLSDAIQSVFTWVLPDISPAGWPIRPWDKQDEDYGALIGSHGTYEELGVYFGSAGNSSIIERAIQEAKNIADDPNIGYTNGVSAADNMGEVDGDMNCLGFVVNAYSNAGAPEAKQYILDHNVGNFSRVGDALTNSGFTDITDEVNINASSFADTGLQKGDLLWKWYRGDDGAIHGHIAMIYNDEGTLIEATADNDGVKGDAGNTEICVTGSWTTGGFSYALRYTGGSSSGDTDNSEEIDLAKVQFVGDSWIEGLSSQGVAETSYFYGVTGKSAADPEMSIDNITVASDASAIILYLGVNNTSSADAMNNLIDELITRYNIPVYVVKVNHVGTAYTTIDAATMNSNIDSYNSNVQSHCSSTEGAYFIDSTSGLQDENGYLSSELTSDGLHLNSQEAYQTWYDNIVSAIEGASGGAITSPFEGYEGGEYVSSPVTGKVIEYGTHKRENVYTGETEEVGYVVIEAIGSECFTPENVSNNSGDTEDIDNQAAADGLNLFYDEYEETCAGFTITIDGFKVDLNTTDDEGNNGTYEQNEVMALYNSAEQEKREENEQAKDDAPFFINYGESANLGSLPEEYYCDLSDVNKGYYIKEGKYLGVTYTDDESAALATTDTPEDESDDSSDTPEDEEYTGPANYIRIMVKDKEYSIIDNVEDYFDIPELEESGSNTTGEYGDLEAITEASSDTEKVRAAMTYFVSQGFTPEGAAGIMGNLIQESSLDPTAVSPSGYHGLAQWNTSNSGGHWWDASDGIRAWIISQGYNETDYAGQIRAIYEAERRGQMTENLWAELKALTNIEQAAELFAVYYEACIGGSDPTQWYSPGTNYQELNLRKHYAQNAYDIYMGDDSRGIKD